MLHTLITMTIRGIHRNSLRTRSVAALGAGVLALSGLAACGSDDSADDADQTPASESAEVTTEEGEANPEAEAKRSEREQIALGAEEVEGLALQVVSPEQFAQSSTLAEQLSGQASMQFDPPECNESFDKVQGTGAVDTSAAAGRLGQDPNLPNTVFIVLLNDPSTTASDYTSTIERCGEVQMTLDLPGQDGQPQQNVLTMNNEIVDAAAPEGVEEFFAAKAAVNGDSQGQPVTSGSFLVSGKVDGTAVQVNAQSTGSPISPEAEQRTLDLFNQQAQKLQNA